MFLVCADATAAGAYSPVTCRRRVANDLICFLLSQEAVCRCVCWCVPPVQLPGVVLPVSSLCPPLSSRRQIVLSLLH